ncbi:uncharacterized protein PV09_04581 [Verruconis gallopava]|uniref:Uncharacterized protein n=1 Tax=Verruconis gallopava TaxID=253628 RepID=A0A0D2AYN5_9PEZI|nr:uncharacterized protein PV09_04581 [Verruconis gallopava]KIW04284.1 hypothetical protein PV09_04581 [Verruconis gallopava]
MTPKPYVQGELRPKHSPPISSEHTACTGLCHLGERHSALVSSENADEQLPRRYRTAYRIFNRVELGSVKGCQGCVCLPAALVPERSWVRQTVERGAFSAGAVSAGFFIALTTTGKRWHLDWVRCIFGAAGSSPLSPFSSANSERQANLWHHELYKLHDVS